MVAVAGTVGMVTGVAPDGNAGSVKVTDEHCQSLLVELAPRLEAARTIDRELDRHLAHRFNVFKYLRTDELGLSRVIADLLDPTHEHGQGTTFLKAMLDAFSQTRGRFSRLQSTLTPPRTERATDTGRIDITVDIPDGNRSFCLAFENKPYAPQKAGQVSAYLRYLAKRYERRFLLVYLPPSGKGPSRRDGSETDCELWEKHFVVMPYEGENSLADWFATCRKRCKAERVRMFLREAELFCGRVSGESMMTADRATKTAKKYLLENSRHLRTALAVHDAWFLVRDEVCNGFLEHLRDVVEDRLRRKSLGTDCRVGCHYGGDKRYSNFLWIFRDAWKKYEDPDQYHPDGRTTIRLETQARGPNGWILGVCSPKPRSEMTDSEVKRRDKLDCKLRQRGLRLACESDQWPQYERPESYVDWNPHVPDLHEEFNQGGGDITNYFADKLLKIADKAICAINAAQEHDGRGP